MPRCGDKIESWSTFALIIIQKTRDWVMLCFWVVLILFCPWLIPVFSFVSAVLCMSEPYILVLYYSKYGTTRLMARAIAAGIEQAGVKARIRTVPENPATTTAITPSIPLEGELYASLEDLQDCAGLALGSPTRFGNMAAPMKFYWDQTATQWLSGALQGKPACVFTTSGSMHGGQETTLITMMIPLLHHGMLLMGLPYSEVALSRTTRGGTPYGASQVSGTAHDHPMTADEKALCIAQGLRLGMLVRQLSISA